MAKGNMLREIEKRKLQQISICLNKDVQYRKTTGFERFELEYNALPEVDYGEIDISTEFLGHRFSSPLFITAMTGGCSIAKKINENLAAAAQKMGIGMGVGSQRASIEHPELAHTYQVRHVAPDIMLFGNLGAAQIAQYDVETIGKVVEMIGADGLAIHLNAVQEAAMPEGDRNWKGVLKKIGEIKRHAKYRVLVKEVGCGITASVASRLEKAGIDAIDVSGAGGTSWPKAEYYRAGKNGGTFEEFGIQTSMVLEECAKSVSVPLIAAGGIRNGLEAAKALAMGATLAGFAFPVLKAATESKEAVIKVLERFNEDLRTAMFLVGAGDVRELRGKIRRV